MWIVLFGDVSQSQKLYEMKPPSVGISNVELTKLTQPDKVMVMNLVVMSPSLNFPSRGESSWGTLILKVV